MSPLDDILRKVEAGEPLTDAELHLLEARARATFSLRPRLAVAHALLNLERAREALPLLEALAREAPRDVEVHLGLARAYVLLERHAAAEGQLKAALALRPEDPEALKAFALLRLRHGEAERARAVAQQVLQVDPFDTEAQLLAGEMEQAGARSVGPGDARGLFRAALFAALRQLGVPFRLQGEAVLLRPPTGAPVRLDVGEVWKERKAAADPRAAAREVAEGLALVARGLPATREELLARVLPVLVPRAAVRSRPSALFLQAPAGLAWLFVVEHPSLLLYVPTRLVVALQVEPAVLEAAARERLEARPAEPLRVPGVAARLWTWRSGDGADSARLLCAPQREWLTREVGPGPWAVRVLGPEAPVVCRLAEGEAVRVLRALPTSGAEASGLLVLGTEGGLEAGD